ncbi:MAG: hypothetical protein EAZ62_04455 [Sphingobacteriia bacterium]|nr:MAG: hypothetical protein EAZ62_04455 [Sphingobacteriia bacterium]
MRSIYPKLSFLAFALGIFTTSFSQTNSPFSRYGIGNLSGPQHTISRGMGGLQAVYADGLNNNVGLSVNFNNPATYSQFYMMTYDLALNLDSRNLKSNQPAGTFSSVYLIPGYVAIGTPLNVKKGLGLAFGLKPLSRVNYSVITRERTAGDSLGTNFNGSGGSYDAFVGVGKKWKNFSVGVNTGYRFGRKETATLKSFLNDTLSYQQSNSSTATSFGNFFFQGGLQYELSLYKKDNSFTKSTDQYWLRFGATATLQQNLNATRDIVRQTYALSAIGNQTEIDSVFKITDEKGTIVIPATYEGGIMLHKTISNSRGLFEIWSFGLEYSTTQWTKYRYYGQPDALRNSWMLRLGGQFSPNPQTGTNYLSSVNYRFGVNIGQDYIDADGNGLRTRSISFGAGLPIRRWRSYETQYTVVQMAFQYGKRGSSVNNITENFLQVNFGVSLNDKWFIKRRYD